MTNDIDWLRAEVQRTSVAGMARDLGLHRQTILSLISGQAHHLTIAKLRAARERLTA